MSTKTKTAEIAIVVPVFDEQENILPLAGEIHAAMQGIRRSYELIFVDDASADGTWDRIREAHRSNAHVRAFRHKQNAGQSAALWTGIRATTSPILVTMDGDRQNDPRDLSGLLAELEHCDFVCGVRAHRVDNWLRRVSARVARAARRRVLGVDFRDTGCAFRAFRRETIEDVFPFNGVHRFLPVLVHSNGARVKEVPISHRARVAGKSKYGVWNRLWRGIYDLMGLTWYQRRRLGRISITELSSESTDPLRMRPSAWTKGAITMPVEELQPIDSL
jgi:glycosyltransferase involved in cell wall biosynthesis